MLYHQVCVPHHPVVEVDSLLVVLDRDPLVVAVVTGQILGGYHSGDESVKVGSKVKIPPCVCVGDEHS